MPHPARASPAFSLRASLRDRARACALFRAQVAKFLVHHGVDTRQGKNGISPFHMACYRGHLDIVTFLAVEQNFSPTEVDGHGRTPIEVARRAGRDDVLSFLQTLVDAGGNDKPRGSDKARGEAFVMQNDVACAQACTGDDGCIVS